MLSTVGGDIKFVNLNCKGLNNPIKRRKVLHYLRHLDTHVLNLKETHLRVIDIIRLKKSWTGKIYHSSFSSKSRGVAILLHRDIPFVHVKTISDSIPQIETGSGITSDPLKINKTFQEFYADHTDPLAYLC